MNAHDAVKESLQQIADTTGCAACCDEELAHDATAFIIALNMAGFAVKAVTPLTSDKATLTEFEIAVIEAAQEWQFALMASLHGPASHLLQLRSKQAEDALDTAVNNLQAENDGAWRTPVTSDATRIDGRPSECARLRELNAELLAALKSIRAQLSAFVMDNADDVGKSIAVNQAWWSAHNAAIKAAEASQRAGE